MNDGEGRVMGRSARVTGVGGVLVVGLGHSGKTEVRSLLETSPRMFGVRRSRYWAEPDERWGRLDADGRLESCLRALERNTEVADWLTHHREGVTACLSEVEDPTYSTLLACLHQAEAQRRGQDLWCVQVGGVGPVLPLRLEALPELKVIHMVRDPRDRLTLSSPSPRPGRRGWDLGRWERSVQVGLECRSRFPDRYMLARWEDLISHPDMVSADVSDFVGCVLDPSSVLRPSTEKRAPRGGIVGPHTVTAVRESMMAVGYTSDFGGRPSVSDLIEWAALKSYRISGKRMGRRREHRAPGVLR